MSNHKRCIHGMHHCPLCDTQRRLDKLKAKHLSFTVSVRSLVRAIRRHPSLEEVVMHELGDVKYILSIVDRTFDADDYEIDHANLLAEARALVQESNRTCKSSEG